MAAANNYLSLTPHAVPSAEESLELVYALEYYVQYIKIKHYKSSMKKILLQLISTKPIYFIL